MYITCDDHPWTEHETSSLTFSPRLSFFLFLFFFSFSHSVTEIVALLLGGPSSLAPSFLSSFVPETRQPFGEISSDQLHQPAPRPISRSLCSLCRELSKHEHCTVLSATVRPPSFGKSFPFDVSRFRRIRRSRPNPAEFRPRRGSCVESWTRPRTLQPNFDHRLLSFLV